MSGAGSVCYRCEKTGHFARECPEGRHGGGPHPGSSAVCYRCDRTGHFARDCPEQELDREADKENSRRQQDSRDRVAGAGARERKDPRERDYAYGEGGGLRCYRTGRWGVFGSAARPHLDQEPGDRERCYRCSATGHIARYRVSLSVRLHHIPIPTILHVQELHPGRRPARVLQLQQDWTHFEGLPQRRHQDVLQMWWNRTYSQRLPQQGVAKPHVIVCRVSDEDDPPEAGPE